MDGASISGGAVAAKGASERIGDFVAPPPNRLRPAHALISVLKLILNKEDTRQVFETIAALSGGSGKRLFARVVVNEAGRRIVTGERVLETVLQDREALRALPQGSLGRAYLHFMESEGLTIDGLRASADEAGVGNDRVADYPEFSRLFRHMDVSHDLWHVLTGYGRDALGEACNLEYTYGQTGNTGLPLIIWIGAIAMKLERPDLPILKALAEGRRMGKTGEWILGVDIEPFLALPLEEARRRLGLNAPWVYEQIPAAERYALLKPKLKNTQSQRESHLAEAA